MIVKSELLTCDVEVEFRSLASAKKIFPEGSSRVWRGREVSDRQCEASSEEKDAGLA